VARGAGRVDGRDTGRAGAGGAAAPSTSPPATLTLERGGLLARLRPAEGAVLDELGLDGVSVLARTPWAEDVTPAGHATLADEASWVARWRGGWQLCAPSSGQPSPAAPSFHGEASLAPWRVEPVAPDHARGWWTSRDGGLAIERSWRLTGSGTIEVASRLRNTTPESVPVIVAEHLILGGDLLTAALDGDGARLELPRADLLALSYSGEPDPTAPPVDPARLTTLDRTTPPLVTGIADPDRRAVTVVTPSLRAEVTWRGLRHALLWTELAASREEPWGGRVVALGIEPTTTPHGGGLGVPGAHRLDAGATLAWSVGLRLAHADDTHHPHDRRERG